MLVSGLLTGLLSIQAKERLFTHGALTTAKMIMRAQWRSTSLTKHVFLSMEPTDVTRTATGTCFAAKMPRCEMILVTAGRP